MLSPMEQSGSASPGRRRDERGSSLVEFALVATLLCTLLLGIVIFGVLLSKRQVLTQAAAEGARYAVPISYTTVLSTQYSLLDQARIKTNQSLEAVGNRQCPSGTASNNVLLVGSFSADGIRCTFTIFDCIDNVTKGQTDADTKDCIEVKIEVNVSHDPAIVPAASLVNPFVPSVMTGRSVVGLSGLS